MFVQGLETVGQNLRGSHEPTSLTRLNYTDFPFGAAAATRLLSQTQGGTRDFVYDSSGNTTLMKLTPSGQGGPGEARASYYGADGRLRRSEFRWQADGQADASDTKAVSEEYRYDALGRRVWVSSTRSCDLGLPDTPSELPECRASFVRRTVWDGAQELVEIQMPLGPVWEENDTAPVTLQHTNGEDQNPYYGRVLYTPGLQVDQPVAVTRVGYHDQPVSSTTPTAWPAFTLSLFWNSRGQAALGAFSDGAAVRQLAPGTGPCSTGSDAQRCVRVFWPTNWAAYDPRPGQTVFSWHGSLLEDKMDKVGTGFRRNRHYDPQTGRFTQEDPIGLAGGVNLYGFAAGDPVNFADPFGLCPHCGAALLAGGIVGGIRLFDNLRRGRPAFEGVLRDAVFGGAAVLTLGASLGVGPALGVQGGASSAAASLQTGAATVTSFASKASAREALADMGLTSSQSAAALRAVARATSTTTIEFIQREGGDLLVNLTRPGRNGFQSIISTIGPNGLRAVTQLGVDRVGQVVVDPKFP